ncbi:MAG: hypothetical protein K2X81_00055 [Candidatus Obscuribacterales bacterium]|nr:hypothetical protein [Candidatus Obscuribacterales bacterium]
MGLFLGNLHINTKDAAGRKRAIDAIRQYFEKQKYQETPDANGSVLSVELTCSADFKWTTLISEEWQFDPSILSSLGCALSKETKSTTFTISIHDSSSFSMSLFENGKALDTFSTEDAAGTEKKSESNPNKWRMLLDSEAQQKELQTIWNAEFTFAEEKLSPLSRLLHIPEAQLSAVAGEAGKKDAAEQINLYFRKANNESSSEIKIEKEASIFHSDEAAQVDGIIGKNCIFVNKGLPFVGYTMILRGSALSERLVSLNRIIAKYYASTTKSAMRIGSEQYSPTIESGGDNTLVCKFNDLKISAPGDPEDRGRQTLTIFLKGDKIGSGDLHVKICPNQNESASINYDFQINVTQGFRKPLKFSGNPFDGYFLKRMSTQKYLFGMAVAEDKRENWIDLQSAFEQLVSLAENSGGTILLSTQKANDSFDKTPSIRKKKLAAAELSKNKQWLSLLQDYKEYQLISAEIENQFGVLYEIPTIYSASQSTACVHTCIWTLMPAAEKISQFEQLITKTIRKQMQRNSLQGFMAAWDWRPEINRWFYTLYEQSCFGASTGGRHSVESLEWCKRFLRAMEKHVWLGPELIARLGDKASLATLPGSTMQGEYAELTFQNDEEINRAELLLESILPSVKDLS